MESFSHSSDVSTIRSMNDTLSLILEWQNFIRFFSTGLELFFFLPNDVNRFLIVYSSRKEKKTLDFSTIAYSSVIQWAHHERRREPLLIEFDLLAKCEQNVCLPRSKSAHAKFPISKWVGERNAKSTHNAISTRIFPRIVSTIMIARQQASRIVQRNGRERTRRSCSVRSDDERVSFDWFKGVNETIGWKWDSTCMWIRHMEKQRIYTRWFRSIS